MSRHGVTTLLLILAMHVPSVAEGEASLDLQFVEYRLASVPLPGTADEVLVDEEQTLEVFLSPSDFPDALVRLVLTGVNADFAINLDISTLHGEALPQRVQWPELGGRPLSVVAPSEDSGGVPLAPPAPRPPVSEDELADQELHLEWYIQPEESDPQGPLRGQLRAVRLSTSDDQTLATWIAPPPLEGCQERVEPRGAPRCHVSGVSRAVRALAVDSSGRFGAVAGGDLRPRVDVWELSSFVLARRITFPPWQGTPLGVEYTPDGRYLVVVDGVGAVHLWNAGTGGEHRRLETRARAFALLDSGHLVALANADGGLTLWRTTDGTITARLGGAGGETSQRLVASGDGQRLAALRGEGDQTSIVVWQLEDQQIVGRVRGSVGIVDVGFDGSGEHILVTHDERGLMRAPIGPSESFAPFGGDVGRRCRGRLALSPDDTLIACTLERGAALLDAHGGQQVHLLGGGESGRVLDSIEFTPDGSRLLATGGGELLEWSLPQLEASR